MYRQMDRQTDRKTDRWTSVKQYASDLSIWGGIKNFGPGHSVQNEKIDLDQYWYF